MQTAWFLLFLFASKPYGKLSNNLPALLIVQFCELY